MTLEQFIDLWAITDKKVILCCARAGETEQEVIDLLFDIGLDDTDTNIDELTSENNVICVLDVWKHTFPMRFYLKDNILNSNIITFSIKDEYLIIFLDVDLKGGINGQ